MLGKNPSVLSALASTHTDSSAELIEPLRLSAAGGEVVDDSSSVSSRSSNLAGCQTPRSRINSSSPGLDGKKPDVIPKPPHQAHAQVRARAGAKAYCVCFVLYLPGRKWVRFYVMSLFHDNM